MDVKQIKAIVTADVDSRRERLTELSLRIHVSPELGFHEEQASKWLSEYLEENGFAIESGIAGLATAFRATYGKGKPVIGILAEYDALPKLGHACGHNIICCSAVGAGIAARKAAEQLGGTIKVIGTPAEELFGGKIPMVAKGAFSELDLALMVHGGTADIAASHFLACQNLYVDFYGKAAHAAAWPEQGINALEAMIQSYVNINSIRQHIRDKSRIHGIITDGGEAANIVPAHSAAYFIIRAEQDGYLDELKEKVLNCFIGAATATGARLEYRWGEERYASMKNNLALAKLFQQNMESLGRKVFLLDPGTSFGSSDIGNVSQIIPAIHPWVAIAPPGTSLHTQQFAQAAASEAGMKGLIDAAKAMAMTVVDLLASPAAVKQVKEEFERGR